MNSTRIVLVGLLCSFFAPRAIGARQSGPAAEVRSPLGVARERISIEPDAKGRVMLGEVLKRFEGAGDWELAMDGELRALVERIGFFTTGPIEAEPEAVPVVVDALLANADLAWTIVREEPPLLLEVLKIPSRTGPSLAERAFPVPLGQLPRYAEHAALLVRTRVPLPNSDVRTLSNSFRTLVVDPNRLQLVSLTDSASVETMGSARATAELVAMLQLIDGSTAEEAQRSSPVPLPSSDESVTLRSGGEASTSLLELVREYARATAQVAILNDETHRLLSQTLLSLDHPISASGSELATLAEELLAEQRCVVVELLRDSPRLCSLASLHTTARGTVRADARFVDAASIADCARRPATLFLTVIRLPHLDVRAVSNSLLAEVKDPNVQQIVPAGNSDSLFLLAHGRVLAELVERLHALDAEAARRSVPTGR